MAQNTGNTGAGLGERPALPARLESVHPGLHPSLRDIPVTPAFELGESTEGQKPASYFAADLRKLRGIMEEPSAQSPGAAAAGATSNADILRRMSLTRTNTVPVVEADPRTANPELGLSGGIISATFCIPHSVKLRKGADWVGRSFNCI